MTMNGEGTKLLDFTGMMEYRVGEYYPVTSTNLILREIGRGSRAKQGNESAKYSGKLANLFSSFI